MKDLKIKVNNEAESKEVQEFLFELGYEWGAHGKKVSYIDKIVKGEPLCLVAWQISDISKRVIQIGCGDEYAKEITLTELRAMVKPMKEYLNKTTYEYKQAHTKPDGDWVCIPEGAEILSTDGNGVGLVFWKDGFNLVVGLDEHWDEISQSFKDFFPMRPRCKVLWQRPQQPEALPFIDDNPQSLNEQYAEIEQVCQAIKVKSGSGSDHMADAMSYGIMGAGAANGGAKQRENSHYFIDVSDVNEVDFYEIAKRYNVADPAIQHILKKCLAIGNRGHKDLETDLKDIFKTAKRALQINGFGDNNG